MSNVSNAISEVGLNVHAGKPILTMHIDDASIKGWQREIYGIIEAAGAGANELVKHMTDTVLSESKRYVPKDTFTLYNSGYTVVSAKRVSRYIPNAGPAKSYDVVVGTVGYGDNEQAGGPNPISGIPASSYAWKVHEDLSMSHPNGGQAKFLERAYREYNASELGVEMVNLERCIYQAKKYTPVFKYTSRSKTFTCEWTRKKRNTRTSDKVSNLDRLSEIYSSVRR